METKMESYKHWIVNGDKNGNELFNQLPFNVKKKPENIQTKITDKSSESSWQL